MLADRENILYQPYIPSDESYLDRGGVGIDPAYSIYQEFFPV